jgi:uncharacterized BrkB/YihY/UPF0761 family membrane protein
MLSPLLLTATSVAGMFYKQRKAQAELIGPVRTLAGEEGAEMVEAARSVRPTVGRKPVPPEG